MVSTQEKVTKAYKKAYDKERSKLFPLGAVLRFIQEKPGVDDAVLVEIRTGWLPATERARGSIETIRRYNVLDLPDTGVLIDPATGLPEVPPTLARMTQAFAAANRLVDTGSGERMSVDSFNAPYESPSQWVFFCTELQVGALR